MNKSLLDETKTILKSLVVSSSEALTTDRLNRDYKDRIGKNIPFHTLGYADLKSFLRSIPDVLTLDGHFVKPAKSAGNSSHVLNLVQNQKPKRNRHETSNRRASSNNCYDSTDSRNSYRNRQQPPSAPHTRIWDNQPSMPYRHQQPNLLRPFEPGNLLAPPNTLTPDTQMFNHFYKNHNNNGNSILGMPRIPSLFSIPTFPNFNLNDTVNRPNRRCVSNQQNRNSNVQRNQSNKKPTPSTSSSADQFDSKGKMNGNVVSPSSKKTNGHAVSPSNVKTNGQAYMPDVSCSDSSEQEVDALPPMDDDDPIRFIGLYGSSIPPAIVPDNFIAGNVYQIFVTEVSSLPYFYFQLYDDQDMLSEMQDQLCLRYADADDCKMKELHILVGSVCAAYHADQWMRAEIISRPDEYNRLKLFFVDFGTIADVPIEDIRHLDTEYSQIPRLCHRGALESIEPLDNYKMERKMINMFCKMVDDNSPMAIVSDIIENGIISMTLVDTSDADEDVIINKILLESLTAAQIA